MIGLVILAAVLPAFVLLKYIYRKDSIRPEPTKWLLKGFFYGVLSTVVSTFISSPLGFLGFYTNDFTSVGGALSTAFFGAAIPEEAAKLFMLWLLLRKNPYFDEKLDGVVYAACIGMGFASLENIMYLFSNYNQWVSVGIMRALISVPGHFMFAVIMGYYYSIGYWGHSKKHMCLAFLYPMLLHGIFDSLLMMSGVTTHLVSTLLFFAFIYFFMKMRKKASTKISELMKDDEVYSSLIRFYDPYDNSVDEQ